MNKIHRSPAKVKKNGHLFFLQKLNEQLFSRTQLSYYTIVTGKKYAGNFPERWVDRYTQEDYFRHDVAIKQASFKLPCVWSTRARPNLCPRGVSLFEEAAEHNICDGFSMKLPAENIVLTFASSTYIDRRMLKFYAMMSRNLYFLLNNPDDVVKKMTENFQFSQFARHWQHAHEQYQNQILRGEGLENRLQLFGG